MKKKEFVSSAQLADENTKICSSIFVGHVADENTGYLLKTAAAFSIVFQNYK
jgi:hypothetical protein